VDAEDVLISEQQREILREEVANLPERDRTVLTMRFGLDGEEERTLDEVSQVFGVTRERIRQIQVKALAKLKKRTRLS
jgi:RNA polymerase primary sigma factor